MRFSPRTWNYGPALHSRKDPGGGLGVCSSGLHVFCGSGEGVSPGPLGETVGGAAGLWGKWVTPQGHPISALLSVFSAASQFCFQWVLTPAKAALCPILFVIFMDRISMHSHGGEGLQFGGLRISSLLFADDVVLMASSACDLQHSLDQLPAK